MLVKSKVTAVAAIVVALTALVPFVAHSRLAAQPAARAVFTPISVAMRWRPIGPFRGGRTKAITGVPGAPNVFYMAPVNGGVWKTTDYGRTWNPIFDDQPTGSIGAIAVAPSDPNIIYVGSGEGLAAARSLGRRRHLQIDRRRQDLDAPRPARRPADPADRRRPAQPEPALRRRARPSLRPERGARRLPLDRRRPDLREGALQGREHRRHRCRVRSRNPDIVYAALWEARQGPWENGAWTGTGGGIFKSTDGGTTWRQLTNGLPAERRRAGRPRDRAERPASALYASVAQRRRRSASTARDDAGETLDARSRATRGRRDASAAAICRCRRSIRRTPTSSIVASTVAWKSTDGGKTWTAFRGAPGGDDYQRSGSIRTTPNIIADRERPGRDRHRQRRRDVELLVQPADRADVPRQRRQRVPVSVCGGQQESGSACVASRGNDGADHVPRLASGRRRGVRLRRARSARSRHRLRRQGHALRPAHRAGAERRAEAGARRRLPHAAHRAGRLLARSIRTCCSSRRTRSGRRRPAAELDADQPDLTRKTWEVPPTSASTATPPTAQPTQRGVIYTIAPSPLDINRIWAGTDDGLIHVDRRRRRALEGRHAAGAEAVDEGVDHRRRPLRRAAPPTPPSTRCGSTTCARTSTARTTAARPGRQITNGIPDGATGQRVREDPKRKGLLFAGTEREVYVSFDDGEHWQSLRLNMPATSIRDLIVKDDDLIAGDARPRLLDPRRHHAAAADERDGRAADARPVQAADGVSRPLEHEHRHAAAARRAGRRRIRPTAR